MLFTDMNVSTKVLNVRYKVKRPTQLRENKAVALNKLCNVRIPRTSIINNRSNCFRVVSFRWLNAWSISFSF